ncbi:MAG: hypothetical protein HFI75_08680 [Lachnospiraceae bacterium]|nr:hypothetical protein [Lachnospiraceae bacterium]
MSDLKLYGLYDSPEVICHRHVLNDAVCSPWYEWAGISKCISAEEFIKEIEKCNMDPKNLGANAYPDDDGIIIDYGLWIQFWIPNTAWKNQGRDLKYIMDFIKNL